MDDRVLEPDRAGGHDRLPSTSTGPTSTRSRTTSRCCAGTTRRTRGRGYVDWYAFDHPQLGQVELGGWDIVNYWFNVPFDRLEEEVAPHADWAIFQALISPLLEVRPLEVERLGGDVVPASVSSSRTAASCPTNVSDKAVERQAVREIEVELDLPDGARLVAGEVKTEVGQLKGRIDKRSTTWWGNDESTSDLAKLEWVIEAPAGTEIGLTAGNLRTGTIRRRVTLEALSVKRRPSGAVLGAYLVLSTYGANVDSL